MDRGGGSRERELQMHGCVNPFILIRNYSRVLLKWLKTDRRNKPLMTYPAVWIGSSILTHSYFLCFSFRSASYGILIHLGNKNISQFDGHGRLESLNWFYSYINMRVNGFHWPEGLVSSQLKHNLGPERQGLLGQEPNHSGEDLLVIWISYQP